MTTNTPAIPTAAEAARDLHRILDQIAAEYGAWPARTAALELRTAVMEGRIDGTSYLMTPTGCACVIGHLSAALDVEPEAAVPAWVELRHLQDDQLSPVESLVSCVGPGEGPQSNRDLAALLGMIDDWLSGAEREVLV